MKSPPPRMRDIGLLPRDDGTQGRDGTGPVERRSRRKARNDDLAEELRRKLRDANVLDMDDTAEIPTARIDIPEAAPARAVANRPGRDRQADGREDPRDVPRTRGLTSLALASGTGEDVAALATSSPRPRWKLAGTSLRVVIAALALICLVVWGWMALHRPSRDDSSEILEEKTVPSPSVSHPQGNESASSGRGSTTGTGKPQASGTRDGATAVVYITGEVTRPGVYTVPATARINDVVGHAGGLTATADVGRTNLAAPISDGDHIHVLAIGEQQNASGSTARETAGSARGSAGSAKGGTGHETRIDVNTADSAELEKLPGIGPATAAAIIKWREDNGPFRSVEDLLDVSGIGEATLAKIRDLVRV